MDGSAVSIDESGLDRKVGAAVIPMTITDEHPLLQLANTLPWKLLCEAVLPDIKATTVFGKWWLGRPLRLRIHLGAYLLQQLFNFTDRQTEYAIKDNAAYQLFCGHTVVKKWHCPDHTKIEEFRSRLSPQTQHILANTIAKHAVACGFADPNFLDIDSTVQEANMAYPSDVHLLVQLGIKAKKVWAYMQERFSAFTFEPLKVDLKAIKQQARKCYFDRTKDTEEKNHLLSDLWSCVFKPVSEVLKRLEILDEYDLKRFPWPTKRLANQLTDLAHPYFIHVVQFLLQGKIQSGKSLCFHLKEVACFNKNKPGKKYQFGRAFQLCRLKGNFMLVGKNNSIRMEDKQSLIPLFECHQKFFPETPSPSTATDKGYYSKKNCAHLKAMTGSDAGLQKPTNVESDYSAEVETELINRRAGIEPLIGHVKHGGQLGRSRMKCDRTIESSGYTAVLGFNMRQMVRCLMGKAQPLTAT